MVDEATTSNASNTPTATKNTVDNWYNPDFDQQMGQELITAVQETIGCFECGNPDPIKTCSRCKLAKYCSPDCQKADWRKSHKELCSIYLENKTPNGPDPGAPVPILLMSVGLIGEADFETAMKNRRQLFFGKAALSIKKPLPMSFSCAIVAMFGKARLVIAPSFADDHPHQIHHVPHLVLEVVDEDPAAMDNLQKISTTAFGNVVETWTEFYIQLEQANIRPIGITCGTGLHQRLDELEEKLNKKGISGLVFAPSSHLLFS